MGEKTDIAVIKNDIKHIIETIERMESVLNATHQQAIKTNGRVSVLEVKEAETEKLKLGKRMMVMEKWKYGLGLIFMVVFSLISAVGYKVLAWSLDGMMRENLNEFAKELDEKIDSRIEIKIKKVLSSYQFEIIK